MSQGKTAHSSVSEVCSVIDQHEISPSHKGPSSPIYHGGTKAVGHGVKHTTGALASHGKSTRPKPHGSKTTIGKKDMVHQKSHGR